jgi:hypothetical protein
MFRVVKYFFLFAFLDGNAQTADCKRTEATGTEDTYPVITKTCTYKTIQTIVTGTADYTGRYEYFYSVTYNGRQINNSGIFNPKQNELLNKLNEGFRSKFETYKKDKQYSECFGLKKEFVPQQMNSLGIEFEDDKIKFTCVFGLAVMCAGANEATVVLKIKDIEKYLKD